jgi:hypothetical protein
METCSKLMFTNGKIVVCKYTIRFYSNLYLNRIVYLQTTIFPFVNINLEQVSIYVTPDIKWTIPGSR